MVTIKNEFLTAKINERGAELKSLSCNGKEYIWYGDPKYWASSAPHLFPICGGLVDGEYIYDSKPYQMQKHGYVRFCDFEIENKSRSCVTFIHKSSEETKKVFPFDYTLRINFSLVGKTLSVLYSIDNDSEKDMYFSIGPHEGFLCPDGIENYDILFDDKQTLYATELDGDVLSDKKQLIVDNSNILPLKYNYFDKDALVFKNIEFNSLSLINKKTKEGLKLDFSGHSYLVLWSKQNAPYICIEPWHGIHDTLGFNKDFKNKEGIQKLEKNSRYFLSHNIEVL